MAIAIRSLVLYNINVMSRTNRWAALEMDMVRFHRVHDDPQLLINEFDSRLTQHADFMRRTRAVSHRSIPLLVGAAGVGFTVTGRPLLFEGANNSPFPGARRDCAEMDILEQADQRQCEVLCGLHVAGPSDLTEIEEINGLPRPVLDLCSDCRGLLLSHPSAPSGLRIVNLAIDAKRREVQTLGEVHERYESVTAPLPSIAVLGIASAVHPRLQNPTF
jgi:hypothetical protein